MSLQTTPLLVAMVISGPIPGEVGVPGHAAPRCLQDARPASTGLYPMLLGMHPTPMCITNEGVLLLLGDLLHLMWIFVSWVGRGFWPC